MPALDCAAVRQNIPLLRDCIYLNTGTEGLLAEPVLADYLAAIARQEREGHLALDWRYTELDRTRRAIADLLGVQSDAIAFTRNATDGHNIVLQGIRWQPGDELLISDQEHPALSHPAAYLQDGGRAAVRVFRVNADPKITRQNVATALSPRTRLVAFSHVSCESGIRLPAAEICHLAQSQGVLTLVDGAQSLGAIPENVKDLNCDFYVSNGHKWLCGPKGTGILYVRPDRLDALDLSGVGAGTFAEFTWQGSDFRFDLQPSARRFEFGTRNHAALVGLHAALTWLAQIGFAGIFAHMRDLSRQAHAVLAQTPGVEVITPQTSDNAAGIITFKLPGREPAAVSRALWDQGIITRHTTTPPGIRASAAYFNTLEDFERLAAALRAMV